LLSLLIFDMTHKSRMMFTKARYASDGIKAFYLAKSGMNMGMLALSKDGKDNNYDGLDEDWAKGIKDYQVEDGLVTVIITDESSKFNINRLVAPNGRIDEPSLSRFKHLLDILDIGEESADRIVLWIKENKKERYSLDDASELLNIIPSKDFRKLEGHITVHSAGLININTVDKTVLASLSPLLTDALINEIITYRKESPFKKKSELMKITGMDDLIMLSFTDIIDVRSSGFSIQSQANVGNVSKKLEGFVKRQGEHVERKIWREVF
ncbi:MAG: helix-hairpin-helix domain-containing protein, partial [Nitrospirota bacterium]